MIFSILVQKYGISHQCNYRLSASTINTPLDGEPDPAAVSRLRQELEANSSMTPKAFQTYRAVSRMVTSTYARGSHDLLFKGKWCLRLLEATIERIAAGRLYSSHGISNRFAGCNYFNVGLYRCLGRAFQIAHARPPGSYSLARSPLRCGPRAPWSGVGGGGWIFPASIAIPVNENERVGSTSKG